MNVKIFTLKFSPILEGFDDEALRRFISDKNVIEIRDHFFTQNHEPYWCVMVIYTLVTQTAQAPRTTETPEKQSKEKGSFREILTDQAWPAFNRLKEWRRARAMKDSVPPFVVFNDRQLARIAVKAPGSLNRLSEVEGVGRAKLEKYGKEVLDVIHQAGAISETAAQKGKPAEKNSPKPPQDQPQQDQPPADEPPETEGPNGP